MNAIDTNVLIYACDQRDLNKHRRALAVIRDIESGVLLWQVAVEFIAAARKLEPQGFRTSDAWDRLMDLSVRLTLVCPTLRVLLLARELHLSRQIALWDATILAGCIESGVARLYSEDVPARPVSGLEIINPFTPGAA